MTPVSDLPAYPSEDAVISGVNAELMKLLFPASVEEITLKAGEQRQAALLSGRATATDIAAGSRWVRRSRRCSSRGRARMGCGPPAGHRRSGSRWRMGDGARRDCLEEHGQSSAAAHAAGIRQCPGLDDDAGGDRH